MDNTPCFNSFICYNAILHNFQVNIKCCKQSCQVLPTDSQLLCTTASNGNWLFSQNVHHQILLSSSLGFGNSLILLSLSSSPIYVCKRGVFFRQFSLLRCYTLLTKIRGMLNARILHCHSTIVNFTSSISLICPSRIMHSMKIMALKLLQ